MEPPHIICITSDMININQKQFHGRFMLMPYLISQTINIIANFAQNARSKVYYYAKYGILHIETVAYYEYYAK